MGHLQESFVPYSFSMCCNYLRGCSYPDPVLLPRTWVRSAPCRAAGPHSWGRSSTRLCESAWTSDSVFVQTDKVSAVDCPVRPLTSNRRFPLVSEKESLLD